MSAGLGFQSFNLCLSKPWMMAKPPHSSRHGGLTPQGDSTPKGQNSCLPFLGKRGGDTKCVYSPEGTQSHDSDPGERRRRLETAMEEHAPPGSLEMARCTRIHFLGGCGASVWWRACLQRCRTKTQHCACWCKTGPTLGP